MSSNCLPSLKAPEKSDVFWQKPVLIAPIGYAFSPIALPETPLELPFIDVGPRTKPLRTLPSLTKKTVDMLLKFYLTCLAFFGRGDNWLFYWEDCCSISVS
jgi:hypothetical protein